MVEKDSAMRKECIGRPNFVSGTGLPDIQDCPPATVLVVMCQIFPSILRVVFDAKTRQSIYPGKSTTERRDVGGGLDKHPRTHFAASISPRIAVPYEAFSNTTRPAVEQEALGMESGHI